jgi:hypothetical protein
MTMRFASLLIATSLVVSPACLPAQRMSCTYADSVARLDALSRDDRELAGAKLLYCPDIRVAATTSLLRRGQSNAETDTLGRMIAWALFDPKLVDSVAVLAKDPRQPSDRRVLFVGLLARYADCGFRSGTDSCPDDRHPLPAVDRDRARNAIAWVAQHDSDIQVRAYAARVSEELTELWTAGLQTPSNRP